MNVGFISLGCSKNLVDTEKTIDIFKKHGYDIVNNPKEAEIIVINTCGFIETAKEEAINTILEMAEYKKENCKYIIAMGCLVQRYRDELEKSLPEVDLFIKYDEYDTIWSQIDNLINKDIIHEKEEDIPFKIRDLLEEYKPNIVIITGHDAYYNEKNKEYKNSMNFVNAVKEARKYEKEHDKLIIIAGACQSNYEELIKAGANFASSPKRINIHALDPAIIATKISLTDVNNQIDVKSILKETKYGESGIGGIITKGTMYIGYPR